MKIQEAIKACRNPDGHYDVNEVITVLTSENTGILEMSPNTDSVSNFW